MQNVTQSVTQDDTQNELQNEHQNEPQNAPQNRLGIVTEMILANDSIAISAIAQNLNVSRDSIKRDLKKLGYVWEGASKNGHWVAKSIFIFPIS